MAPAKRKAAVAVESSPTKATPAAKKTAVAAAKKAKATPADADADDFPTNKEMPSSYDYPPTPEDQWKLVTFNVNSLPAAVKKGFKAYVAAEQPTVLCVQETKVNEPMAFLMDRKSFPYQYWSSPTNGKKGYSGTAVFSKVKPLSVRYGMKPSTMDDEGRVITLEFDDFFLINCYTPNAGDKLVRLPYRQEWDRTMNTYLTSLEATKPFVYTGDLNVAHQRWDLSRPDTNTRSAGFTIEERDGFSAILGTEPPRVDTFRHLYPEEKSARCYTFFSYRFMCRAKKLGWRLDYFVASQQLLPRVVDVRVRSECYGASDHVPLVMWLKKGEVAPATGDEEPKVDGKEETDDSA
ncbi:hypothetical protein IWQ60_004748 [Tieghemiomyces parasiticus]|uniref:Endonuclease/exonuclease/phosphatase domain-containing protein n=1 Tax=Tieghemiomyces parasiticus TaxID=78921 RepID=A0A9W8ADP7_9FUNG|nr:hypothetical protein IWQ60_004748 [Tieghemiomyces parasiticus]